MSHSLLILAQAAGGGPQMLLFVGGLFAIMYFLVIAPQQKQAKQQKALLGALKKGDEVVTQGGLIGRIHTVGEKVLTLEVANGVRVQMLKSAVQGKTLTEDEAAKTDKLEKADKGEKKEEK